MRRKGIYLFALLCLIVMVVVVVYRTNIPSKPAEVQQAKPTLKGDQVRAALGVMFAKSWSSVGDGEGDVAHPLCMTSDEIQELRSLVASHPQRVILVLKTKFAEMVAEDISSRDYYEDTNYARAAWYENNNFGHRLFIAEIREAMPRKWGNWDFDGDVEWYHGDELKAEFPEYDFDFTGFNKYWSHADRPEA